MRSGNGTILRLELLAVLLFCVLSRVDLSENNFASTEEIPSDHDQAETREEHHRRVRRQNRVGCREVYHGETGVLVSPGYPDQVQEDLRCQWVIITPTEDPLTLVFFFDDDPALCPTSGNGWVFRDGEDPRAARLRPDCTSTNPRVTGVSSVITIIFNSSMWDNASPFKIVYSRDRYRNVTLTTPPTTTERAVGPTTHVYSPVKTGISSGASDTSFRTDATSPAGEQASAESAVNGSHSTSLGVHLPSIGHGTVPITNLTLSSDYSVFSEKENVTANPSRNAPLSSDYATSTNVDRLSATTSSVSSDPATSHPTDLPYRSIANEHIRSDYPTSVTAEPASLGPNISSSPALNFTTLVRSFVEYEVSTSSNRLGHPDGGLGGEPASLESAVNGTSLTNLGVHHPLVGYGTVPIANLSLSSDYSIFAGKANVTAKPSRSTPLSSDYETSTNVDRLSAPISSVSSNPTTNRPTDRWFSSISTNTTSDEHVRSDYPTSVSAESTSSPSTSSSPAANFTTLVRTFVDNEVSTSSGRDDNLDGGLGFLSHGRMLVPGEVTHESNGDFVQCFFQETSTSGIIFSPEYPNKVQGPNCTWVITAFTSEVIEIAFTDLDIDGRKIDGACDETFSHLKVTTFDQNVNKQEHFYCGKEHDIVHTSHENLWVDFRSHNGPAKFLSEFKSSTIPATTDSFVDVTGDSEQSPETCKLILHESRGVIQTPRFPALYPRNRDCIWTILALPGRSIMLDFDQFDIDGPVNDIGKCDTGMTHKYSFVKLSYYTRENLLIDQTFCGSDVPGTIRSNSNRLSVFFQSGNGIGRGFEARFSSVPRVQANPFGRSSLILDFDPVCTMFMNETSNEIIYNTSMAGPCFWFIQPALEGNIFLYIEELRFIDSIGSQKCVSDPSPITIEMFNRESLQFEKIHLCKNITTSIETFTSFSQLNLTLNSSSWGIQSFIASYKMVDEPPGIDGQPSTESTILPETQSRRTLSTSPEIETSTKTDNISDTKSTPSNDTLTTAEPEAQIISNISSNASLSMTEVPQDVTDEVRSTNGSVITIEATTAPTLTSCNETLSASEGVILAGAAPGNISKFCSWKLESSHVMRLELRFTNYTLGLLRSKNCSLESRFTVLSSNVSSNSTEVESTFCGSSVPAEVNIIAREVTMVFIGGTFEAFYKWRIYQLTAIRAELQTSAIDNRTMEEITTNPTLPSLLSTVEDVKSCQKHLRGPAGNVSSPNYPNSYPPNLHCIWLLHLRNATKLIVVFQELDLKMNTSLGNSCADQDTKFRISTFTAEIVEMQRRYFCGNSTPGTLTLTGDSVVFHLETGSTFEDARGFHLIYSTVQSTFRSDVGDILVDNTTLSESSSALTSTEEQRDTYSETLTSLPSAADNVTLPEVIDIASDTRFRLTVFICSGVALVLLCVLLVLLILCVRKRNRSSAMTLGPELVAPGDYWRNYHQWARADYPASVKPLYDPGQGPSTSMHPAHQVPPAEQERLV